jgi:Fe2+ transport system protein FeoA
MSLARSAPSSCTRAMAKSERVTQEWTLGSVATGISVNVVAVLDGDPETLLLHGIRPGVRLVVESDAPFGGPRIVRIGGCRVAIDRRLSRSVRVAPDLAPTGTAPADRR